MTHRDRTQSHHRGGKTGVRRAGRLRLRRYLAPVVRHVLLVAVAIAFLVPFYWMAISALKDNSQIFARPHPVVAEPGTVGQCSTRAALSGLPLPALPVEQRLLCRVCEPRHGAVLCRGRLRLRAPALPGA